MAVHDRSQPAPHAARLPGAVPREDPLDALRDEWLAVDAGEPLDPAVIAALTDPLSVAQEEAIVARLLHERAAEGASAPRARRAPGSTFGAIALQVAAACLLTFLATRPERPAHRAERASPTEAYPSLAASQMQAALDASLAEAVELTERGEAYAQEANFDRAEALLRAALSLREQVLGPYDERLADSLTRLASLYQSQHMDAKAEPLYFRALELRPPVVVF